MISVHSRQILALVIALVLAAVTTFPTDAEAITTIDRVIIPLEFIDFPCNGEQVFLSGELLLIIKTTIDAGGGIHEEITRVPLHLRGVGSVTGTQYQEVGGETSQIKLAPDATLQNFTDAAMFNLVSQGGTDNLQVKITFHITVNANGEVAAFVDDFSRECVG